MLTTSVCGLTKTFLKENAIMIRHLSPEESDPPSLYTSQPPSLYTSQANMYGELVHSYKSLHPELVYGSQ